MAEDTQTTDTGSTDTGTTDTGSTDEAADETGAEIADVAVADVPEVERLHGVPVTESRGQTVLHPGRDEYVALISELRDVGYWMCIDLCAVDYLTSEQPRALPHGIEAQRYEIVVQLLNHTDRTRLRVRVQVPGEDATIPSLFALHPSVENPEREVFDMFGITFDDHPDSTRILMPDTWEGHPLRKDYEVGRIPVQFKGVTSAR